MRPTRKFLIEYRNMIKFGAEYKHKLKSVVVRIGFVYICVCWQRGAKGVSIFGKVFGEK